MKHPFFTGRVDWYSMNPVKESIAKVKDVAPKRETVKKLEKSSLVANTSYKLDDLKITTQKGQTLQGTLKGQPVTVKCFKLSDTVKRTSKSSKNKCYI